MNFLSKAVRLLILLLAAVPLSMAAPTWTTIDVPGAIATVAYKINTAGQVVGYYTDSGGLLHGFLLSGGTFTTIDYPGARNTVAAGINDSGQIVGYHFNGPAIVDGFLLDV